MVLTDEDIKVLKEIFATKDDLKSLGQNIKAEFKQIRQELHETENRIYLAIGNMIGDQIIPEQEDLKKRVSRIEQVPVIAHAIKK